MTLVRVLLGLFLIGVSPCISVGNATADETDLCPKQITPLISLSNVTTFYRPTATQSVIDPAKLNDYAKATWQFDALLKRLVIASEDHHFGCLDNQMKLWADSGALLSDIPTSEGVERRQAIMIQAWTLVAVTSAYQQYPDSSQQISPNVVRWIGLLAESIYREFSTGTERPAWLDEPNNHRFWAGLAVLRANLLAPNNTFKTFGENSLKLALDNVAEDGTLPLEIKRGSRAVHYMNFALSAVAGLVDTSLENGGSLDSDRSSHFDRLVERTIILNEEVLAGRGSLGQQNLDDINSELGWLPFAKSAVEDKNPSLFKKLLNLEDKYGTPINIFLGRKGIRT